MFLHSERTDRKTKTVTHTDTQAHGFYLVKILFSILTVIQLVTDQSIDWQTAPWEVSDHERVVIGVFDSAVTRRGAAGSRWPRQLVLGYGQ